MENEVLITTLANEYNNHEITWHDIQDIVDGQIFPKYGKDNWKKGIAEGNKILEEIAKRLK